MSSLLLAVLAMALAAQGQPAAQGRQARKGPATFPAPAVVWEKSLPDSSRLTVTRAEVPVVPLTEEQKRERLSKLPPGSELGEHKHVYRYSFTRAAAGGPAKEVWAYLDADFGDGLSTGVTTVLDAAVEGDHLIVALKSSTHYFAQVLDSKKDPLVNDQSVLLTQDGLRPQMVTGGSITGSLAEGTLAVQLRPPPRRRPRRRARAVDIPPQEGQRRLPVGPGTAPVEAGDGPDHAEG
jgi:hypothetical protein